MSYFFQKVCFTFFLFLLNNVFLHAEEKPYKLTLAAIFKNEARHMKEWVEYHHLVGVEHFYLYNNGSTDDYLSVLQPYIQSGLVTLTDWPNQYSELWNQIPYPWVFLTLVPAFEHAVGIARQSSKWLISLDLDEFLVPVQKNTILEVLDSYGSAPGVEIKWHFYGASDVDYTPRNRLLVEMLTRREILSWPNNQLGKTIVNPDLYNGFTFAPHRCAFNNGQSSVLADHKEIIINHYLNKDKEYFYGTKIPNREAWENRKYSEKDIQELLSFANDEEDPEKPIHRFLPQLRKNMGLSPTDPEPIKVQSFEVFDFLVGRLDKTQEALFDRVEREYPYPNFAALRKNAEALSNGTLVNIYEKFRELTHLTEEEAQKLMNFEFNTDYKYLFPIVENISKVKNYDVLISDCPYDLEQMKKILQKAGLECHVSAYFFPYGKKSGQIWNFIKNTKLISPHQGPDTSLDVEIPKAFGIRTQQYIGSQYSPIEQKIDHLGHPEIATIMRALRLQNPYPKESIESMNWNQQAQVNLPLLIEASLYLSSFCKEHSKKKIVFSAKNTSLWQDVFQQLFPEYITQYGYLSENLMDKSNQSYVKYIRSTCTDSSLIAYSSKACKKQTTFLQKILKKPLVDFNLQEFFQNRQDIIEKLNKDLTGNAKEFLQEGPVFDLPTEENLKMYPAHSCIKKALTYLSAVPSQQFDPSVVNEVLSFFKEE